MGYEQIPLLHRAKTARLHIPGHWGGTLGRIVA